MVLVFIVLSLVAVVFFAHYNFWRPVKKCSLPRILMYHNTSKELPSGMNISPELLEKQIQYFIKKQYTFLKISDLPNFNELARHVVLTFDDGFVGNYTYLFEFLKKYKVPATIYLTPDIQGVEALTPSQIKEMQASGLVEFGAHTMTHVNLTKVDKDAAQKEIAQSKEAVEKLTGISCESFAYPYGRYNEQHVQMVKNAGFTTAVTTQKAIAAFDHSNPYTLPRLSISGCINMIQFYLILSRGRYKL